jgi:dCMP deaminase
MNIDELYSDIFYFTQDPIITEWDRRFLELAEKWASWSKDPSTKVGSVICRDKRFVCGGFNGFAKGLKDTDERLKNRDWKIATVIHAEINALLFAKEELEGCSIYTWPFPPCSHCSGPIIQKGISRVIAPKDIPERWLASCKMAEADFKEAGLEYILI